MVRGIYSAFCALKGRGKVFKSRHAKEEILMARKFFPEISLEKNFPIISKGKIPKLFPYNVSIEKMGKILIIFSKYF